MPLRINCALKTGLSPFSWRLLNHLIGELAGSVTPTQLQQILSCPLQALPQSLKGFKLVAHSSPLPCTQNIIQRGNTDKMQNPSPQTRSAVLEPAFQRSPGNSQYRRIEKHLYGTEESLA